MSDRPPANGLGDGLGDGRRRGPVGSDRLAELDRRLAAARGADAPAARDRRRNEFTAASMAWRMVIELVTAIVVGGAMGWGLDTLFGTMPLFLIVLVLFGAAAGVRMMLRTAQEMNRARPDEAERNDRDRG